MNPTSSLSADRARLQLLTFSTYVQPLTWLLSALDLSFSDAFAPLALQKDMPAIKKLNVPPLSAAREFWSLSVSPKDAASDMDTVLVVDEDHEQGHTKVG